MDLNEARKVVWIGSNRRPLGELLDLGYLTKDRLEWAVAHVSDPRVQQAAAVLLGWVNRASPGSSIRKPVKTLTEKPVLPGLDAPISMKKAQETIWPFSPYKGEAMGTLVASRKLSLKDLGWAIENARDPRIKAAAITLTASRLQQVVKEPESPKGHLKVISEGRSFSERRQLQFMMLEGLIYGFFLGVAVSYLYYSQFIQEHKTPEEVFGPLTSSPTGIIILILAFCVIIGVPVSIMMGMEWTIKKMDKAIDAYRKGQEGEEKAAEIIHGALNGDWTHFRNMELPGRGGDLDSVLVGPAGIWVLEVKNLSGKFQNVGDQWECLSGKKWNKIRRNPSQQAKKNAGRLGEFLKADGIKEWVNPAVVWANPESPVMLENQSVAVWTIDRLEDELGNIQYEKKISETERNKICDKLTKLIERRK
ncbi:MAG: nuclease-related domain-containing protein [Anaerolineales bacterium]